MDDIMVQQRDLGKAYREIADVRGDVKELRVAIVGIDGTNGLRGELREFIRKFDSDYAVRLVEVEQRVEEGIAMGKQLYEVERHKPGACIGKAALDSYVAKVEAQDKRSTDLSIELRKARLTTIGAIIVAGISSAAPVILALVTKVPTP